MTLANYKKKRNGFNADHKFSSSSFTPFYSLDLKIAGFDSNFKSKTLIWIKSETKKANL